MTMTIGTCAHWRHIQKWCHHSSPPADLEYLKAVDVQHSNDNAVHYAVLHLYRAVHLLHHPVKQALVRTLPAGKRKLGSWEQTASYSKRRKVMLLDSLVWTIIIDFRSTMRSAEFSEEFDWKVETIGLRRIPPQVNPQLLTPQAVISFNFHHFHQKQHTKSQV